MSRIPTHQMSKYFLPLENPEYKKTILLSKPLQPLCLRPRLLVTTPPKKNSFTRTKTRILSSIKLLPQNTPTVIIMASSSSPIFSNDTSASNFRRAVRRQAASRHEYAVSGAGPSAQGVQQAYLRYVRSQDRGIRGRSTRQAPPPPYTAAATELAERDEQAPPPYTATIASATPTAQLNTLLYNNITTPPSPPEYSEVAAASPPNYDDIIALRDTATTSRAQLSHHNINNLFAGHTTRTPRKHLHNTAVQALNLVAGSDGPELPPRPKRMGVWSRMKGKI